MILEYRYDASSESIAASDSPHLNATHLLVPTLYYANSVRQATITDVQESSAQVEVGLR